MCMHCTCENWSRWHKGAVQYVRTTCPSSAMCTWPVFCHATQMHRALTFSVHYESKLCNATTLHDLITVVTGHVIKKRDALNQCALLRMYTLEVSQCALRASLKISLQQCTVNLACIFSRNSDAQYSKCLLRHADARCAETIVRHTSRVLTGHVPTTSGSLNQYRIQFLSTCRWNIQSITQHGQLNTQCVEYVNSKHGTAGGTRGAKLL